MNGTDSERRTNRLKRNPQCGRVGAVVFSAIASLTMSAAATADTAAREYLEGTTGAFVMVNANDPWAPEDLAETVIVPAAHVSRGPVLDGRDDDAAWRGARSVNVPLRFGQVNEATVTAVYTEKEIFLLVSWPDATKNDQHHPWIWDAGAGRYVEGPQAEDALLVSVEGGCDWNPSLLAGHIYDFDAWWWLAARSDPLGQAVDADGSIQNHPLPQLGFTKFNSRYAAPVWDVKFVDRRKDILTVPWQGLKRQYKRFTPEPEVYVRYQPDGRPAPAFAERVAAPSAGIPANNQAAGETLVKTGAAEAPPMLPQYRPVKLSGDAGEVAAKGRWADGRWSVEFRRARVTAARTSTDSVFERATQLSLHIFDGTERLDESSESVRLLLQFESPATATVQADAATINP